MRDEQKNSIQIEKITVDILKLSTKTVARIIDNDTKNPTRPGKLIGSKFDGFQR